MKEEDIVICRCEDITLGSIKKAIKDGARDVSSVKRLTRAGMGTCQGYICEYLIEIIISKELGISIKNVGFLKTRLPVHPIKIKELTEIGENGNE